MDIACTLRERTQEMYGISTLREGTEKKGNIKWEPADNNR